MTAEERGPRSAPRGSLLGPRLVAAALVALAVILIVSALGVGRGGGYQLIGPATIPLVVAISLLVLGGIFAIRTTLVPDTDLAVQAAEAERATHWPTLGLIGLSLIGYAFALDGLGYESKDDCCQNSAEDEDDDASEDSSESDDSEDDAAEETDDSEESEDTTEDETDEESGEDETAENESGEDGVDVNVTVEASV